MGQVYPRCLGKAPISYCYHNVSYLISQQFNLFTHRFINMYIILLTVSLYYIIIKVICCVNKGIDDQLNTLRDKVQITPTCQEMYGDTPSSLENIAVR